MSTKCPIFPDVEQKRARESGTRIGRPRVFERPQFAEHFEAVVERLDLGTLSRYKAAKELGIGYATIKRILDNRVSPMQSKINSSLSMVENSCNNIAEVVH